jgi:hypothetical protein
MAGSWIGSIAAHAWKADLKGEFGIHMSDEDFGFVLPAFKAEEALVGLRRSLRDLKLSDRGNGLDLRGRRVIEMELAPEGAAISVRVARRLALTPEWDNRTVRSAGDARKLVEEVRKRLERWQNED